MMHEAFKCQLYYYNFFHSIPYYKILLYNLLISVIELKGPIFYVHSGVGKRYPRRGPPLFYVRVPFNEVQ